MTYQSGELIVPSIRSEYILFLSLLTAALDDPSDSSMNCTMYSSIVIGLLNLAERSMLEV
jgi:hypothetical protein